MNFNDLAAIIENTHVQLQQGAVKAVNQYQTVRNWLIGFYIVEFEQEGEDRAKYGEKLLPNLERKLNQKGLNTTLFKNSRTFYTAYPQFAKLINQYLHSAYTMLVPQLKITVTAEKSPTLLDELNPDAKNIIRPTLSDKLHHIGNQHINNNETIDAQKLLTAVSFSHFVELIRIDNPVKRMYYELLTIDTGLSVRELKRQIVTLNYERVGLSCDVENAMEVIKQKIHPQTVDDAIKDDYFFDFLNIPQQNRELLKERELETLLLDNLRDFILELGNGFCLEARQKRILIGDESYYVDMVFYHRILKAHILIELKIGKFDHSQASQLYTYLNYYKAEVMEPGDNPPIGILLVTDKNEALVQYATADMDKKIFVSKYKLQLPTEKQLQDLIMKKINDN